MSIDIDNETAANVAPYSYDIAGERTSYGAFVASRVKEMGSDSANIMHAAIGISGEAGEILDACKKYWVYNKPLDRENVVEELGDALFYMTALMMLLDVTLNDVVLHNVCKLLKRYPVGYSDAAAQQRADKQQLPQQHMPMTGVGLTD